MAAESVRDYYRRAAEERRVARATSEGFDREAHLTAQDRTVRRTLARASREFESRHPRGPRRPLREGGAVVGVPKVVQERNEAEVLRLRAQGRVSGDIARRAGITRGTVDSILKRNGVAPVPAKPGKAPSSQQAQNEKNAEAMTRSRMRGSCLRCSWTAEGRSAEVAREFKRHRCAVDA